MAFQLSAIRGICTRLLKDQSDSTECQSSPHGRKLAWIGLDILLVALLIYQVLVMIRGTRAAPMLVGLVVVALIFYLARIGELTTLNWVVSHVLPYLVFALIVVFQSEIRHVLADLGRRLSFLGALPLIAIPTTTSS